jgi:hypothetical protein
MALAAAAAILLGLLVFEVSYLLTPANSNNGMPLPTPESSFIKALIMALLWMGLAALLAFSIVALGILINRIIAKRKTSGQNVDLDSNFE